MPVFGDSSARLSVLLSGVSRALPALLFVAACANNKSEAKPAAPPPPPATPSVNADVAKGEPGKPAADEKKDDKPAAAPAKDDKGGGALPGVDTTGLDPTQLEALGRFVDEKPSACGKGHSLRTSIKTDAGCKRSVFAARYLVRLLKAGLLPSEAEEIYDKRFTSPETGQCDLTDPNMRGNVHAPVTICEFSDFQCPHCKLMEPILQRLLDDYNGQLRLIYKNYPISKLHPDAREAAAAAIAAGKQGRFWQMHDKLFANQDHLTAADLDKYAKELKLDAKKWKDDLPAARERVEKEHAEGEKLDIQGTPTVYVNGRKYAGPLRYEELKDWVDEELNR